MSRTTVHRPVKTSWKQLPLLAALVTITAAPANAAELHVLSGGAAKPVLSDVAKEVSEAPGGPRVTAEFLPMAPLVKRIEAGERLDVVVVTDDVLPGLVAKGLVDPATRTEVGRVGIGVAVKKGAPEPDISTPEKFKAALLAAKSIVLIDPERGTSGKHLVGVFDRLGIANEIWPKTMKLEGGYVLEKVASGEAEIGLQQTSEILPVAGVKLVGPVPEPLQKTTVYVAVVVKGGAGAAAAEPLLAALRSDKARALAAAKGLAAK